MLSSVDYLSAGWPAILPVPSAGDLESRAVLALIPRIREAADRALAQAGLVSSDPNLSARGVWQQKARIGEAARPRSTVWRQRKPCVKPLRPASQ